MRMERVKTAARHWKSSFRPRSCSEDPKQQQGTTSRCQGLCSPAKTASKPARCVRDTAAAAPAPRHDGLIWTRHAGRRAANGAALLLVLLFAVSHELSEPPRGALTPPRSAEECKSWCQHLLALPLQRGLWVRV